MTLNIDNDRFDAPVATVAYGDRVTSSTPLYARTGPSTVYPAVTSYAPGTVLPVMCQVLAQKVGTTSVWDKLGNGLYVTGFSAPLPQCTYPCQVTATVGVIRRTGLWTSYQQAGSPWTYPITLASDSCVRSWRIRPTLRATGDDVGSANALHGAGHQDSSRRRGGEGGK